jgi:hypothetical protein
MFNEYGAAGGIFDKHSNISFVGFQVYTAVAMKNFVFCDTTPCSPVKSTDVSEEHIASIFRIEE